MVKNIKKVNVIDETVYNVLLEGAKGSLMVANNLLSETLSPLNPFVKEIELLNSSSLSEDEKMEYVERINKKVRSERR